MTRTLKTYGENCCFSADSTWRIWWNDEKGGYDSGPEEGDTVYVYAGRNLVIDKPCDLRLIKFTGEKPARVMVAEGCDVEAADVRIDENYGTVTAYDNVTVGFNAGLVRIRGRFCRVDKCAPGAQICLCRDCNFTVINDAVVVWSSE